MKNKKRICLLGLIVLLVMSGCSAKKEEELKGPYLFYLNTEGTALKKAEYKISEIDPLEAVTHMVKELKEPSESIDMKSAIPSKVKLENTEMEENHLKMNFNHAYLEQDQLTEILCRAAIVQSVTQIEGVYTVEFLVENQPLQQKNGEYVGIMQSDSFVQDTQSVLQADQSRVISLYFSNEKGDGLIKEEVEVNYKGNIPIERVIIDQLSKGPVQAGLKPILPSDTQILNISIKEGICYVNLDKHFLDSLYDVEPKVVIYGIVNSLLDTGNVNKVQILVEGNSEVKFQESVSLKDPFDRNLELVKK